MLPPKKGSGAVAHFKLIPLNNQLRCIEFDAVSASSILEIAMRSALGETDVYRDGSYQCTVSHGRRGVWHIAQRKAAPRYSGIVAGRGARPIGVDPKAQFMRRLEMA